MTKTLNVGEHRLVFTRAINDRIADDEKFAGFVWKSLLRFNRGDWGETGKGEDSGWNLNDSGIESLNSGGLQGQVLAAYRYTGCYEECHRITIWISRNVVSEDGTQAITVLFPSDY